MRHEVEVAAIGLQIAKAFGGRSLALRYRGLGAFTQRSPRSGRLYACGGTGATLLVDAADVDALLRTRLFTRA